MQNLSLHPGWNCIFIMIKQLQAQRGKKIKDISVNIHSILFLTVPHQSQRSLLRLAPPLISAVVRDRCSKPRREGGCILQRTHTPHHDDVLHSLHISWLSSSRSSSAGHLLPHSSICNSSPLVTSPQQWQHGSVFVLFFLTTKCISLRKGCNSHSVERACYVLFGQQLSS